MPLAQNRLSVTGSPVLRSAFRMVVTLAVGTACRISAHTPATCGAAIDVPLATSKPPPGTEELIASPGANSDRNGVTFENHDTASAFVVDPTLTAEETQAGEPIEVAE